MADDPAWIPGSARDARAELAGKRYPKPSALKLAIVQDGQPAYVIAAIARIHTVTLSRITSGAIPASPAQRERIARALECTESDLFDADGFAKEMPHKRSNGTKSKPTT